MKNLEMIFLWFPIVFFLFRAQVHTVYDIFSLVVKGELRARFSIAQQLLLHLFLFVCLSTPMCHSMRQLIDLISQFHPCKYKSSSFYLFSMKFLYPIIYLLFTLSVQTATA